MAAANLQPVAIADDLAVSGIHRDVPQQVRAAGAIAVTGLMGPGVQQQPALPGGSLGRTLPQGDAYGHGGVVRHPQEERLIRVGAEACPPLRAALVGYGQAHHALIHVQAAAVVPPGAQGLADGQRPHRHGCAVLLLPAHEALHLPVGLGIVAPCRRFPRPAEGLRRGRIRLILVRTAGIKGDVAQLHNLLLHLAVHRLTRPAVAQQHALVERRAGGIQRQHMMLHGSNAPPVRACFLKKRGARIFRLPLCMLPLHAARCHAIHQITVEEQEEQEYGNQGQG